MDYFVVVFKATPLLKHLPTITVKSLRKECLGVFPWRELWFKFSCLPKTQKHSRWEKHSSIIASRERNVKKTAQKTNYMWPVGHKRMERERETELKLLRNRKGKIRTGHLLLIEEPKRSYIGFKLLWGKRHRSIPSELSIKDVEISNRATREDYLASVKRGWSVAIFRETKEGDIDKPLKCASSMSRER